MRAYIGIAVVIILTAIGPALAADVSHAVRVRGGDVRLPPGARMVLLEGRSTIHLPIASEKNSPVLVVVLKPAAIGSTVLVEGQTIQGFERLELSAPEVSVLLHPVNGLGYVR
ncbi:hypothetical protein ACVWZR_004431 [Bradyrhizobium sp. i1.3.1]